VNGLLVNLNKGYRGRAASATSGRWGSYLTPTYIPVNFSWRPFLREMRNMKHELNERTARNRKRVVRQISAALLGPIVGKLPKSSIESLEKVSYYDNIDRHILDIIPLANAAIVRHDTAATFPPFIRTEAVFGKRNLYVLRDAVVSPNSGMAWIEGRIIEESVGSLRRIMGWGDLLHEPLLPESDLQLQEPVVVCHPASYYHWLLEVLPNLLMTLSNFPAAKIVMPENCPGYIMEGLATALGREVTERFITCSTPIRVETLLMPQYHHSPEFTCPEIIDLLRSSVKSKLVTETSAPRSGSRIYISRRRAGRRRLKGEEMLEERLQERGFTILHLENVSFDDQIRIFHDADTVVATHGAGLSNIVWSETPCKVVEIFPKNYILDCYAWLSFSLGLDYRYIICDTGHRIDEAAIDAVLQMV
jgi:hypothetical protein